MPSGDHSAIHFPDVGGANVSRHPSTTTEYVSYVSPMLLQPKLTAFQRRPCSTLVDSDSSSFVPRPNSTYEYVEPASFLPFSPTQRFLPLFYSGLPPSSVGCATPKPTPPLELAPAGAGKTSKRPWRRTSKPCDGQRPKGEKDKPIAPKPKPKPQRPRGQAARPAAQNGKDGKKDGKSCVIM